jgi:Exonuclease III
MKMIAGDLNASVAKLPTLKDLLENRGWADTAGDDAIIWGAEPNVATCKASSKAQASRIDYIVVNPELARAVRSVKVDVTDTFPQHQPITIEIARRPVESKSFKQRRCTNADDLMQQLVKERIAANTDGNISEHDVRKQAYQDLFDTLKVTGRREGQKDQ